MSSIGFLEENTLGITRLSKALGRYKCRRGVISKYGYGDSCLSSKH